MMNQLSNTPNAAAIGGFGLGTSGSPVSLAASGARYGTGTRPWADGIAGCTGPAIFAGRPAAQPIYRDQLHTMTPNSAKRGVSGPHPPREPV